MTSKYTAPLPTDEPTRSRGSVFLRALRNPAGLIAGVVIAVVILVAILADVLAPYGANESDLTRLFEHGGDGHLLGTDGSGRDVVSLLIYGTRSSLIGAAIAVVVAMLVGVPTGLVAGFYGRWFDTVGMWISSAILALPGIVVLLAFRASVSTSMWAAMLVFGVLLAPAFFNLVRAAVRSVRNELYVDAARVSGVSDARIIARHVLTIVRAPIVIQAAMVAALGLMIQAGLEFLGLGDRTTPSWGQSLNEGFQNIFRADHLILWPGLALGITIAAFALFANALRDALDAADSPRGGPALSPTQPDHRWVNRPNEEGDLLSVRDLRVAFGPSASESEVVRGIDLDLDEGAVVGLVGESGSGKTQSALAVLGLLADGGRVTGGTVAMEGKPVTLKERVAVLGSKVGYIPQEPMSNLDPAFTVGSQLIEPIRRHMRVNRAEAQQRAVALLERVGIPEPDRVMRSYPHQISGGMAQRVLIAGAVSCEPLLLIADEPTTALDVTIQAEILDLLRGLQLERGMGLLIVTHDFGVVADICDEVYVMQSGVIVEHQPVDRLFAAPEHDYTKALLGASLEGKKSRRQRERRHAMSGDLLRVDDLVVDFPVRGWRKTPFRALKGVSVSVAAGETLGIVGESGSGKSTLGRAVLGLAPITEGSVTYADRDISRLGRRARRALSSDIQVVFQDPYTSLNPSLTIGDTLSEPLTQAGVEGREANRRIKALLDRVGMPADSAQRLPKEFSGGQRQRIAIARALALEPKLIVCDEPVSALDLTTQQRVLELFIEIQERTGVAYVFVSHDLSVIRHISHRVAVIYGGEVVEQGDVDKVTTDPDHAYTKRLLLASPVPDPAVQAVRRAERRAFAHSSVKEQAC